MHARRWPWATAHCLDRAALMAERQAVAPEAEGDGAASGPSESVETYVAELADEAWVLAIAAARWEEHKLEACERVEASSAPRQWARFSPAAKQSPARAFSRARLQAPSGCWLLLAVWRSEGDSPLHELADQLPITNTPSQRVDGLLRAMGRV